MSFIRRAAMLAVVSMLATTSGFAKSKLLQTATIDGFKVNFIAMPLKAFTPAPASTAGAAYYQSGSGSYGTDPYGDYPKLAGHTFLSLDDGGSATFVLAKPTAKIGIVWGTPDSYNTLQLFDASGTLIGTVNGGDIAGNFGFAAGLKLQIISPTLIKTIVAASGGCCFEFGNTWMK